jgi:hypothetical protein
MCASLALLAGCNASEQYFCDEDGCYYCDGLGCREAQPEDRPECRGDFECPDGTLCTDRGCVTECEGDADCPEGTLCSDGLCLAPNEPTPEPQPGTCERNSDCDDPGLVCRDGLCTPDDRSCGRLGCSCAETERCSAGYTCVEDECRPNEDVCQFNHECGVGRVCLDGTCHERCETDAECPTGQQCGDEGVCRDVPPMTGQCASNDDCDAGQVCLDSVCIDGCERDGDCGDGRYCNEGLCEVDDRPRPFCLSDDECQPGHPCIGGVCRTPCDTHDECLRFDVQFNYCLDGFCATTNEATSDCSTSLDCGMGRECIDGICR